MNYFIGDLHLFNRNQTGEGMNYDGRPFATVAEMNQYILEHWNAKITNGDTVYILGDMAMRGKNNALLALVAQLKGKKILFRGNHDDLSDYRYQRLFEEITDYREIADSFDGKTYKLCLMHYPILMWNGQHRGSILLYAHTHNIFYMSEWQAIFQCEEYSLCEARPYQDKQKNMIGMSTCLPG
mgnify:CR=1 FL=1